MNKTIFNNYNDVETALLNELATEAKIKGNKARTIKGEGYYIKYDGVKYDVTAEQCRIFNLIRNNYNKFVERLNSAKSDILGVWKMGFGDRLPVIIAEMEKGREICDKYYEAFKSFITENNKPVEKKPTATKKVNHKTTNDMNTKTNDTMKTETENMKKENYEDKNYVDVFTSEKEFIERIYLDEIIDEMTDGYDDEEDHTFSYDVDDASLCYSEYADGQWVNSGYLIEYEDDKIYEANIVSDYVIKGVEPAPYVPSEAIKDYVRKEVEFMLDGCDGEPFSNESWLHYYYYDIKRSGVDMDELKRAEEYATSVYSKVVEKYVEAIKAEEDNDWERVDEKAIVAEVMGIKTINTKTSNNMNNIISKDAIRANIMDCIKRQNINLNDIDEHIDDLQWNEDETGRYLEFYVDDDTTPEVYHLSDEDCTALADEDGLMSCKTVAKIDRLVMEVLKELLTEPRIYKVMKRDEDRVYDTFPETVDPSSIYFHWEDDAEGNWHYQLDFEYDEDGVREDSGFQLDDDASIWADDYFVRWTEDMPDEEYHAALDESDREWNEEKKAVEDNYYIFSTFAEAV